MRRLSKEEIIYIVELYKIHRNAKLVGEIAGCASDTVKRWVIKHGIKTNDRSFSVRCRKNIFTAIEKFPKDDWILGYICGWIASDGCLTQKYSISLEIHENDRQILDFFSDNLLGTRFKYSKHGNCLRFRRTLRKLYKFCLDFGITPAKSKTLDVNLIDKSDIFKLWFLRGVIDGDGCVTVGKFLGNSTIRICSASLKFLETLKTEFGGYIVKSGIYFLCFKGIRAKQLATVLPNTLDTLYRKNILIDEILKQEAVATRRSSVLVGKFWKLDKAPLNIKELYNEAKEPVVGFNTFKWRYYKAGWDLFSSLYCPPRCRPIR